MINEIKPTNEQLTNASKATQTTITADINIDGKWKLAAVVITPELVQVKIHTESNHHYFTPIGFSQHVMKIPTHEEVEKRLFNIQHTKKYGKGHHQNLRSYN